MAVRQIDRAQRSALGLYPVGQLCCLRLAEKGIDQQRIMLTPDEGDRVSNPGQRLLAGRDALGGAAALPDEEFPVKRRVSRIRGFHWRFTLSSAIRDRPRTNSWMRDGAVPTVTRGILAPRPPKRSLAPFNGARRKGSLRTNRRSRPAADREKRLLGSRCRFSRWRKPHGSPWRA